MMARLSPSIEPVGADDGTNDRGTERAQTGLTPNGRSTISTMNPKPDPYGRDATRPYHIPLQGWWQVAQRVWSESARDNLSVVAAGCAFFALAAIFPALSALTLLYGLTTDPTTVEEHFRVLGSVLPPQAYEIVKRAN